jgi:hypothetical protein
LREQDDRGRKEGSGVGESRELERKKERKEKKERRQKFKINTCSVAMFITGVHCSLYLEETLVLCIRGTHALATVKHLCTLSQTYMPSRYGNRTCFCCKLNINMKSDTNMEGYKNTIRDTFAVTNSPPHLTPQSNLNERNNINKNKETMVKAKLSLCLIKQHAMETYGGEEVQFHAPADLSSGKQPPVPIT